MSEKQILPVLDTEKLQQKANEFAQKGAEDTIKEFYTGFNSPYKKAIEEHLIHKGIDGNINIPDIIGLLNASISNEVDMIANNAVSKTFVPLVKKFLTRAPEEIKLTDILEQFIEDTDYEHDDDIGQHDYRLEFREASTSGFRYIDVICAKTIYQLSFYRKSKAGETPEVYEIYTLPTVKEDNLTYRHSAAPNMMKLSIDGVTLEMPFTPKVLEDSFMSFIARLVIANTKIIFDVDSFDEDMFPTQECHC